MEPNADVNMNPAGNQTMPLPENNVVPEVVSAGQPEGIVSTPVSTEPVAPTPKASGDGTMTTPLVEPKKKSHAMLLCVILLALVAIGGIVFGAVTMVQKNQQAANYDSQIATLQKANKELLEAAANETPVEESETVVVVEPEVLSNPVISIAPPADGMVLYSLSVINDSGEQSSFTIQAKDGAVASCHYIRSDCSIDGLSGQIYKMATIYEGNGIGGEKVGFIMTDGSVYYIEAYEPSSTYSFTAKKLPIDGFVKDIVGINYTSDAVNIRTWYGSTVFVLGDNSIVKYDRSWIQ